VSQLSPLFRALTYVTNFTYAIDGGANVGLWSAVMANEFEKVISFEPCKSTFEIFIQTTKPFPNITGHNKALGDKEQLMDVVTTKKKHDRTFSYYMRQPDKINEQEVIIDPGIQMTTIDSLGIEGLGLLKLDLEGYEYLALEGAKETLKNNHPVIIIEESSYSLKRCGYSTEQIHKLLVSLGYTQKAFVKPDRIYV